MGLDLKKLKRKRFVLVLLVAAPLVFALTWTVNLDIRGRYFGIFVLKGMGAELIEVRDDLLLGEDSRLIGGLTLTFLHDLLKPASAQAHASLPGARLLLDWDAEAGSGWVRSVYADQTEMHFFFSRSVSDSGSEKQGLFVGGSLPSAAIDLREPLTSSDSGISFHDGHRAWHIWCNANEVITPRNDPAAGVQTADWRFLGSRVDVEDPERIILTSSHEVVLAGVPLRIDRQATFRAGEHNFDLVIHITNTGTQLISYLYAYADEPWLGDYGTSEGTVGWLRTGLVSREGLIDTEDHQYAGLVNLNYGLANVIVWAPGLRPSLAGFSNAIGRLTPGRTLSGNERAINLQWEHTLQPRESRQIMLTIGMAKINRETGIPYL